MEEDDGRKTNNGEAASGFAGSLPVPNVQALAAALHSSPDNQIPRRYIRPESHSDAVLLDAADEIPIIDLARLLDPSISQHESTRLDFACQHWGFFKLVNHGVRDEVIERVRADVVGFFELPLEEKLVFKQLPGSLEGYGQLFVVSEEQKLDWADILHFNTLPLGQRNTGLWPARPSTFRSALNEYLLEVNKVANCLFNIMAKNLGLDRRMVAALFEDGMQSVRINYYPPCPQANNVLGLSPHSDASGLTLVLQLNEVQGLQIKKNGRWVPVKPLPGAFVVNIGDIFEIFSNGKYRSVEHRAVTSTDKERVSIAAFHSPNSNAVIGPFPELVRGGESRYTTLDHESFLKLFFSSKLEGKSFLDRMKLKT